MVTANQWPKVTIAVFLALNYSMEHTGDDLCHDQSELSIEHHHKRNNSVTHRLGQSPNLQFLDDREISTQALFNLV